MPLAAQDIDLDSVEKLREQELEEARTTQGVMSPSQPLGIHKTGQHTPRVLSLLNERLLLRGIPGRHTAIQYALFDPISAQMRLVSPGMPGPMLLRGRECRVLQVAGIPRAFFLILHHLGG